MLTYTLAILPKCLGSEVSWSEVSVHPLPKCPRSEVSVHPLPLGFCTTPYERLNEFSVPNYLLDT